MLNPRIWGRTRIEETRSDVKYRLAEKHLSKTVNLAMQAIETLLRSRMMHAGDVLTPSTQERCATSIREAHEGPVFIATNPPKGYLSSFA